MAFLGILLDEGMQRLNAVKTCWPGCEPGGGRRLHRLHRGRWDAGLIVIGSTAGGRARRHVLAPAAADALRGDHRGGRHGRRGAAAGHPSVRRVARTRSRLASSTFNRGAGMSRPCSDEQGAQRGIRWVRDHLAERTAVAAEHERVEVGLGGEQHPARPRPSPARALSAPAPRGGARTAAGSTALLAAALDEAGTRRPSQSTSSSLLNTLGPRAR